MDVTSTGGTSRNVWDIWAGPPSAASTLTETVNLRNLQLANNPTIAGQQSVSVLSLGRMPIQPLQNSGDMRLVLSPIDISFGGGAMYVSLFDFDPTPPFSVNFTVDSIDTDVFSVNGIVGGSPGDGDLPATCDGGTTSCNGVWTLPQWGMGIPGKEGRVVFFGGNLIATYAPAGDAHTISMSLTDGRPFLTE